MTNYVKLTFQPAGAAKPRTTWAIERPSKGRFLRFCVCDKEGVTDAGDRMELILVSRDESYTARPARMNLHYGELEVAT